MPAGRNRFLRILSCLTALGLCGSLLAVPRTTPTRPGAPPARTGTTFFEGVEYVDAAEVARRFALKAVWLKTGEILSLKNAQHDVRLKSGSREMQVDGLRVFLGHPTRLSKRTLRVSRLDSEKLLAALFAPGEGRPVAPALKVIAIDPGHGGVDQGTENERLGFKEKVYTLDVSLRLKTLLLARGYRVVMTRETDIDVEKSARAEIANRAGADLFVSIHFNSVKNDRKTSGAEVFAFAPQHQRSTNSWSRDEADDTERQASPVNRYDHWSFVFAHAMHRELLRSLKAEDRGLKIAHWAVLRPLNCPGILVESGFLSNDSEGRKISTPAYRQQIAVAMAEAISAYSSKLPTAPVK